MLSGEMDSTFLQDLDAKLLGHLLGDGLIDDEQSTEAAECKAESGGLRIGHLFRLGYIRESDLVKIINDNHDAKAVALSGREIPPDALDSIPAEKVWSLSVLPFELDPAANTIRVACLDPYDEKLRQELASFNPEYNIVMYFALETTLRSAITRHYRQPVYRPVEPEIEEENPLDIDSILPDVPIEDEPVKSPEDSSAVCRLLVLSGSALGAGSLGRLLQHQGYNVRWTNTVDAFQKAYEGEPPQMIMILAGPGLSPVPILVEKLNRRGIRLAAQPVFLIAANIAENEFGKMLELGFEDVVRVENILDLLMIKLSRTRERLYAERAKTVAIVSDLGTHGTLVDMNAIDLLQAMSRSGKTVRISITGHGAQLTIYMRQGQVVAADNGDLVGPEAIYDAIAWRQGVWNVDPIPINDLPEPNNRLTTEAILLEGCRRLDEQVSRAAGCDAVIKKEEPDPGSLTTRLNVIFDNL